MEPLFKPKSNNFYKYMDSFIKRFKEESKLESNKRLILEKLKIEFRANSLSTCSHREFYSFLTNKGIIYEE